jgi:hypothetical protein
MGVGNYVAIRLALRRENLSRRDIR